MEQKTPKLIKPEEEKIELDFNKIAKSVLSEGKIHIVTPNDDMYKRYPQEAQDMLGNTKEEEVKKIIEKFDFSKEEVMYILALGNYGEPTHSSSQKTEESLGIKKSACLDIKQDFKKGIEILANVDLVLLDKKEPEIKVYLLAQKIKKYDFPRWEAKDGGDGQCTVCSGSGCWECCFTGGY
jgi:hypothetical protein